MRLQRRTFVVRLVAWLCLASGALLTAPAAADSDEWLVLPVTVAGDAAGTPSSRHAAQLLARRLTADGARVMAPDRARASFEQRGSTAPLMIGHGDLDALARDAQMALYHVASGLPSKARADVERALARADKVLESLNREAVAAQQLLDACLYLVRAHLQDKNRDAAREQALECRRLVPDVEPDGTMHPPDVIGVLAEAEAALRQREPGSLRVESEPEGCAVFLNGRRLGTAPLELPQLSPGEYRVQAECEEGRAGRVHRVTVASSRVVMHIDTGLDAAVQTSLDLSLRYDGAEPQRQRVYGDALEIARALGVAEVLLVLPVASAEGALTDVVQVDRIRARDGSLLAAARLRVDSAGAIESGTLTAALASLREGAQRDHTAAATTPIADIEAPARILKPREASVEAAQARAVLTATRAASSSTDTNASAAVVDSERGSDYDASAADAPPTTVGAVLGITGGVGMLAGLGLFGYQLSLELDYSSQKDEGDVVAYRTTKTNLESVELVPLIVTGSGALLLTASLPWLLPESPELPVLALVSGIAGGALAITGGVLLAVGSGCNEFDIEGRCTDILATTRLGGILLETALPLGAVPVVYLLRGDGSGEARAALGVVPAPDQHGVLLRIQGVM